MFYIDEIVRAIEESNFDTALALIEKNHAEHGSEPEFITVQAMLCIQAEEYETAISILQSGVEKHPKDADLLYNLGHVYNIINNKRKALNYFQSAMQHSDDKALISELEQICSDIKSSPELSRRTSIVVVFFNNLDYNKICIDSIRQYTEPSSYEIIAVDNASSDGTTQWLREQKDLIAVFNEENLGFTAGCNSGIIKADPQNDLLILNNDVAVSHNWLENLKTCLYSSDNIGAVSPASSNTSNHQSLTVTYENMEQFYEFSGKYNFSNPERWEERLRLVMVCYLIKNKAWQTVGVLDELYSPGNYEDDDYSHRLRCAGYRLMLCTDTYIHHFGSMSFGKDPEAHRKLIYVNRNKFENKWGFDPYIISDDDIFNIELMKKSGIDINNVLHVGCGGGATLLRVQQTYKNANVCGLARDMSPLAGDIAKKLNIRLWTDDDIFDNINEKYQCILFFANYDKKIDNNIQKIASILEKLLKLIDEPGLIIIRADNIDANELIINPSVSKTLSGYKVSNVKKDYIIIDTSEEKAI
ncbi:MAG: glycosyltransferase [Oscillospiraceae bacterium]|nr:glycosyltransferase [Oscillospiraceae bacterium]